MENIEIEFDQLFPGSPNVANGVTKMIQLWKIGARTVKPGTDNLSLQFIYTKGRHAFRVGTATGGRVSEIVIYTGVNDPKRGSPLVKGANEREVQVLREFGFKQDRPGWRKLLSEKTEPDFYANFVKHALTMVQRR